jgi:hypothetical protein
MKRGRRNPAPFRRWIGDTFLRPVVERVTANMSGVRYVGFDGKTILERYTLLDKFGLSVRIHHIVGKDPDPELFHDHPWSWSVAMVLAGSYIETMPNPWARHPDFEGEESVHDFIFHFLPLSINPILHDTFHHLTELPHGDAWTIYINGPRWQPDGFMKRTGNVWTFHPMTATSKLERIEPVKGGRRG